MLEVAVEKVCELITHARAFDAEIPDEDGEDGAEITEQEALESLADQSDDQAENPAYSELANFIDGLNEEEQINLVALTWLGRGDFTSEEWVEAVQAARDARSDHTDTYLLGIPLLGDYLEEGLSQLGYSCED